jgi:drug/metabolite transporter (DMT)-like permease
VGEDQPLDLPGLAAAVLCCALWGGNAVAVKLTVPDIPAFGCAGLRFLIALPLIALVCRQLRQPVRIPKPHWGLVLAHALLTVIQIGTFNWGTSHSLAGRSSILINVHPLVVAPLAWMVLGERMGGRGLAGLVSATFGVLVLFLGRRPHSGELVGDLVVLGSGVIFGVQTIAQKKTFPVVPPTTLLLWQTVVAVPLFLGYSACFEGLGAYHQNARVIAGLLYQGVAVSGICFTTWLLLLRRYPAGRLATIAFVTPIFGVGLGNLVRGEPLTWPLLIGCGLVGWGIYLTSSDRVVQHTGTTLGLPGEDAP